jgi:exopolysaccharide production protein ExoQ
MTPPTQTPQIGYQEVMMPRQPAQWWELLPVSLWFIVTFIPFPNDELLLYPLALYFAGMFALRYTQMVPLTLKCWPLFLLPALASISMFWSPVGTVALRFGIMMTLTVVIAIYISGRFTPRQIILAIFGACAVSVVIAIPESRNLDDQLGLYTQKNIFAIRMMLAMLLSLGVALDAKQPILARGLGWLLIPVTLYLVFIAESATALVLSLANLLILGSIWLFWINLRHIKHLRTVVLAFMVLLGLIGFLLFVNLPNNVFVQNILESLGKDATLTGRTDLWTNAKRISAEQPWFGVGAEGFWQPWVGEAETILDWSYKDPGSKFSFHSVYYEVLVHLGYVGLGLMIFQIMWCFFNCVRSWIADQNIATSTFLLIGVITVITSFTESYLYSVLDISTILFFCAAIIPLSGQTRMRKMLVPVALGEPAPMTASA